jgi:hypothetical protein
VAGIESEVRHRAPKVCGHVSGNCAAVVWCDVAVDNSSGGVRTKAINGLIEADLGLDVVCARHKHNRNASGAELRNTAHRPRVECGLSCCVRPGTENVHIGAENRVVLRKSNSGISCPQRNREQHRNSGASQFHIAASQIVVLVNRARSNPIRSLVLKTNVCFEA